MNSPVKKFIQRKIERTPEVKKVFDNLNILNINSSKKKEKYKIPERCEELYKIGKEKNLNKEIKEEEEDLNFPFNPKIDEKSKILLNDKEDFFRRNELWSQKKDEKFKLGIEKKYNDQEEEENELENKFEPIELNFDLMENRLNDDENVIKHKKRMEKGSSNKKKFDDYYTELENKYNKKIIKSPLKFAMDKDIYNEIKEKFDKNDKTNESKLVPKEFSVLKKVLSSIDNMQNINLEKKNSEVSFNNFNFNNCREIIHKELHSFDLPNIN